MADIDPSNIIMKPADIIMQMASGLWVSRAIWTACRIGVPEAIGDRAESVSNPRRRPAPSRTCSAG